MDEIILRFRSRWVNRMVLTDAIYLPVIISDLWSLTQTS